VDEGWSVSCAWTWLRYPRDAPTLAAFYCAVEDPRVAVLDLERLVAETVALVEVHMPDVSTERVRRDLGARRPVWAPPAGGEPGS
jgi:hypothetical protein